MIKTTITTYNSVDKSYFKKATDIFDEQFKTKKVEKESRLSNLSDDELDELEQLIVERKN